MIRTETPLTSRYYELEKLYKHEWDAKITRGDTTWHDMYPVNSVCSAEYMGYTPKDEKTLAFFLYKFINHTKHSGSEPKTCLIFYGISECMELYESLGLHAFGQWDGCHEGGQDKMMGFIFLRGNFERQQETSNEEV